MGHQTFFMVGSVLTYTHPVINMLRNSLGLCLYNFCR